MSWMILGKSKSKTTLSWITCKRSARRPPAARQIHTSCCRPSRRTSWYRTGPPSWALPCRSADCRRAGPGRDRPPRPPPSCLSRIACAIWKMFSVFCRLGHLSSQLPLTLSLKKAALWNRNYFLRFRFRILKSYGSGSGSTIWKVLVSGYDYYFWKVTVLVPVPVPAPYLDH